MVVAGAAECLDVVGYHPYGFSADADAEPGVASADPTQNCANGFCFRGAELFYDVMQTVGMTETLMWSTETGWLVDPPDDCLSQPGWPDRAWQIVSRQKQAENLVEAFTYARTNWPWMGGIFVFNLNFNRAPWIPDTCEQMRYYAVQGRPAETALTEMPKLYSMLAPAELLVTPASVTHTFAVTEQPYTATVVLRVQNVGDLPLTYTLSLSAFTPTAAELAPAGTLTATILTASVMTPTGMLAGGAETAVLVQILANNQPTGTLTATWTIDANEGTLNVPVTIPVTVRIVETVYPQYIPFVRRHAN